MRTGWADNPRLRELVQRTDPGAHLFAEVLKFADSSVKILESDWAAGTTTGTIDNPESGGARLNAGTNADITQGSDDGTDVSQLTPIPDFDAILVEWTDAQAEERELKNFVARLDPRPDNGQAKDVAEWRAQSFRVVEWGPEEDRLIVMPISREVIVAAVGEAVANIDFDFWDGNEYPRVGPPPSYDPAFGGQTPTRPQTIIRIIALDSDGAPAANVAWMADSTLTGTISGSGYIVTHYEFIPPDSVAGDETGGAVWSTGSITANMPRFTLNRPVYSAGSVTFDGGEAIPDLTGTGDLEIVAHGRTPSDSSLTFKIWNGAAYVECKSADLVGVDNSDQGGEDLSGVSTTGPWNIQVLLTPSASGRSTPTAREFGIRRVVTTNLFGLATINGGRSRVEPMSLKGNVPKAEITILKTGARDFRDYGTTILAENHIGEIEVRLWIGDPSGVYLDRSEWMHHSSWEVEDYRNEDAGHVLECVSPLRRLRTPIPEFVVTGGSDGERTQIEYTNQTPKAVWEDLVDGRVGLPGRFRGPGVESTAYTISKVIKDTDAKNELDRVAYLVGYSNIESQGRLRAVPVMRDGVGAGTPVAIFPIGSYDPVYIGPGYKTRTDEFFVSLDWDEVSQSFETEIRKFNATAFAKLGGAGLNTTQKLEAETAKWIDTDALAIDVANRVPMHFGNGLIVWELRPIYLHPHLEVGDVVGVLTDQFVARSPITDREIRGPVATLAIVVDTHGDVWGRHLSVWVPTFDGIVTGEGDITWFNYKRPRFEAAEVVFLADGSARFRGQTAEGVAVRAAYDDTDFPDTAAVELESLEVVDSVSYFDFEIAATGVFDRGETIWVSAYVYEKADGTGSRSTPIFQMSMERQQAVVIPTVQLTPEQNGTTATLTLVVNDLDSRQTASAFDTHTAGGDWAPDPDPANWSVFDDSAPYVLVETETMDAKHGAMIAWGVRYLDENGGEKWITGVVSFDADIVAHAKITQITVEADGTVVFAYQGDEDTVGIYYTLDSSDPANEPDDPDSGDDYVAGRKGIVTTAVTAIHGETVWLKIAGKNSVNAVATGDDIDEAQEVAIIPPAVPSVKVIPTQSGTTGTVTLEVNDPDSRMTATSFEIQAGGGDWALDSDPANWSGFDGSAPYGLTQDVTLQPKHSSFIAWGVRYTDKDGNTKWLTSVVTLDLDLIAEAQWAWGTVDTAAGRIRAYAAGDEDCQKLYVTIDTGSPPSDPTTGDFEIVGSSGDVLTDEYPSPGSVIYLKVRGWHTDTGLGPVKLVARRLGDAVFQRIHVAADPTQSGSTGKLDLTILDPTLAVTAVEFQVKAGTGDFGGSWLTSWDRTAGTPGSDVTLTRGEDLSLAGKHQVQLKWRITYKDERDNTRYLEDGYTFDSDLIAEVTGIEITFADDGDVIVSATGDEDTANMYVKVAIDSTAANPTSGSNDGTISGRAGFVNTGVFCAIGSEAEVKVIGYDSAPAAGPIAINKARRGVGEVDKTIRLFFVAAAADLSTHPPMDSTLAYLYPSVVTVQNRAYVILPIPVGVVITEIAVRWYRLNNSSDQQWYVGYVASEAYTSLGSKTRPVGSGTTGWETSTLSLSHTLLASQFIRLQIHAQANAAVANVRFGFVDITYTPSDVHQTY